MAYGRGFSLGATPGKVRRRVNVFRHAIASASARADARPRGEQSGRTCSAVRPHGGTTIKSTAKSRGAARVRVVVQDSSRIRALALFS